MPLIFLEAKLDWKAAVDDVLVAVVGLWALLWSGGMVEVLLQRSSALQWAVAAAAEVLAHLCFHCYFLRGQVPAAAFNLPACLPYCLPYVHYP